MSDKKFYVTTPIYYVNARPHIGHAYTTIVADVLARRHRLLGEDTFFLTGTDEHGQKIERSAAAAGIPPQQFADGVSKSFEDLWHRMGITNNDYIRTTSDKHKRGVQHLFSELYARGFIYLASYTGSYCVSDEAFVDAPVGTPCPDCGRLLEEVTEENFFFKLSAFQRPLLDLIESDTIAITPDSRKNEVLSFLRGNISPSTNPGAPSSTAAFGGQGGVSSEARPLPPALATSAVGNPYLPGALKDLSISRSSFTWGIPVPEPAASAAEQKHVIYVWLDALANYMTALGYGSDDETLFKKFWPADLHLVGKEIIRFHCIYWPAFLLALNPKLQHQSNEKPPTLSLEEHKAWAKDWLPQAITAHGWLLFDDSKMSKSKGNIVRTETILDAFGTLCPPPPTPSPTPTPTPSLELSSFAEGGGPASPAPPPNSSSIPSSLSSFAEGGGPASPDAPQPSNGPKDTGVSPSGISSGLQPTESGSNEEGALAPASPTQPDRDLFASDVLRYFLLREIPFGQDGSFSFDALITRYNADLANGYGNLVSRTLNMIAGRDGVIPAAKVVASDPHFMANTSNLSSNLMTLSDGFGSHLGVLSFASALSRAMVMVTLVDGYITQYAPWKLLRSADPEDQYKARTTLYTAAESIRIITALLYPILPYATARVWAQLGLGSIEQAAAEGKLANLQWGGLQPGTKLGPLGPLFPRIYDKDIPGFIQIMTDMENPAPHTTENEQRLTETDELLAANEPPATSTSDPAAPPRTTSITEPGGPLPVGGSTAHTTGPDRAPSHADTLPSAPFNTVASQTPITASPTDASPQIAIDDFAKIELRVAQILVAERIPKADKLLRLEVDLGPYGKRQILSGIAEWYTPEDLIGRRIVVITNLAPRKMRGLESHGMLLAASNGENGKPVLATFGEDIALGSRLK